MIDLRRLNVAMARIQGAGPLAKLLPLVVGSVLVTLLATAASPGPMDWFFQSPVSPVSPMGPSPEGSPTDWLFESPVSPISPSPEGSQGAPEGTVAGPALVAVPAAPNLVPWLVGIILVAVVVGAGMLWSRRRGKGEGSA